MEDPVCLDTSEVLVVFARIEESLRHLKQQMSLVVELLHGTKPEKDHGGSAENAG